MLRTSFARPIWLARTATSSVPPTIHQGPSRPGRPGSQLVTMEAAVAWVILIVAGVFETVWAYYMKLSDGFTKLGPTAATFAAMAVSIGLLGLAMKSLPLGTA